MSQSDVSPKINAELVDKVMRGVGICVFQYQQIESYLKFLLPHIRQPGSDPRPATGDFNWRALIDSKATLGSLVKSLAEKSAADDPERFASLLNELVAERNYLVHHLLCDPERPLRSNEDAEHAIEVLRRYARSAAAVAHVLRTAAGQFASPTTPS